MVSGFNSFVAGFRQQLLACLPENWKKRINRKAAPYELEIQADGASAILYRDGELVRETELASLPADATLAALLQPHKYPLELILPREWLLERRLTLPAAAGENLGQVIGFELDRITPFRADQVYFDYELDSGRTLEGNSLAVSVVVVPRERLRPWLEALQKARIPLDRVSFHEFRQTMNLLPRELRARPELKRMVFRALPYLLLLVLFGAVLLVPLWQERQMILALQEKERHFRQQAMAVLKIRENLQKQLKQLEEIRDQWRNTPPPLEILHVLTRLLPDDTSLQQLEIKGDQLIIRGLSGQASALIGLLEKSPAFLNPHFLSPVTQQRGKELFHLGATIRLPFPANVLNAPGKGARKEKTK